MVSESSPLPLSPVTWVQMHTLSLRQAPWMSPLLLSLCLGPSEGLDNLQNRCVSISPGAIAQSPGREAALAWASLAQRSQLLAFSPGKEQAAGVSILYGHPSICLAWMGRKKQLQSRHVSSALGQVPSTHCCPVAPAAAGAQ